MSIAYILNQTTSSILNSKLDQNLEVNGSLIAPIHKIDETVSISKNPTSGGMILNASVVEATVIETDSINATSGVFTSAINPLVGDTTETVSVNGNLDLDGGFGLKNVSTLTIDGSSAVAGYVLSTTDTNGTLQWKQDATANQSLADVLSVGNTANTNINMGLNQIQNCQTLRVNNLNNVAGTGQINLNCNLNMGNINQNTIFAGKVDVGALDGTGSVLLGRAANRFTGGLSIGCVYNNLSNVFKSDSIADLIDFHDFKSNRGKIYIVDASNNDKFSADDTGLITGSELRTNKLNIPTLTPTAGQVLASSDASGNLYWKDDSTADVSQWATYDAVQNVDMSNNQLNNCSKVETSLIQPTTGVNGTVSIDSYCNITNRLTASDSIQTPNILVLDPAGFTLPSITVRAQNPMQTTPVVLLDGQNGITTNKINSFTGSELTLNSGSDTIVFNDKLNMSSQDITNANIISGNQVNTNVIQLKDPATGIQVNSDIVMTNGTLRGIQTINGPENSNLFINPAANQKVDISGPLEASDYIQSNKGLSVYQDSNVLLEADFTGNYLKSETNADIYGFNEISCIQLNPTYKPERTLYVSQNNTNANKTGSFENPFSTIQTAINYAESVYNNTYWYINVMPGTYTEELTITKKVFITGSAPSNPDANSVGCQLNGSITVSVDTNDADMFNNVVSISNLFITGSIECNSANTNRSVLILTDCYIYQDNGNGRLIHYNPDATDGRLWLFNCRFLDQSTTATRPLIEIDKGMLKMYQCAVIGSGNENILKLGGTARIDSVVLCSFTSNTNSTTAEPIVELSSTGATLTFSQCAFIYSNSANKSANANSCGILLNEASTTFNPVLNLQNCAFSLLGTSPTTNFAVQDANFGTAKAAIILAYGNNSIINTAYQIKGVYNVNKFSNQTVDSLKTPLLETTNIYVNGSNGTANQVLQKDGSNNLVWGAGGGGGGSQDLEQTLANGNTAGAYSINMNNQDITSIKDLYPTNINVGLSNGSISQVLGKDASNNLRWINPSGAFNPNRTLYVDATNTNPSPDGSINNPYANIASAVAYAEANFDVSKYWVVNIAPGSYGTFTITKPRIYFNGVNDNSNYIISNDAPCKITGDVIISCQTAGGNNPIIAFDGLYFNNASIYDRNATTASIQNYNLVLNNCQMEMTTAKDSIIHLQPNSASNLLITNSRFSSTVALSSTRMLNLILNFSKVNAQNSVFFTSQNNICLYCEYIVTLEEVRNCTFTNSTNNNTPLALIRGSTNIATPFTIIQNQFIYSTNTGRVANSRAVFISGATQFQLQCFLINNFFNCLGFATNSFVAGDGSPGTTNGCRYNYFGNCSAVGTTNLIEGTEGTDKIALLSVS
jgi:hypothetical protein